MVNYPLKNECFKCFYNTLYQGRCSLCLEQRKINDSLPLNTQLNNRYLIGMPIGQGGFGITYQCYDLQTNEICIIKEYYPKAIYSNRKDYFYLNDEKRKDFLHGQTRFKEEAKLLMNISKKNYRYIVQVYDYFDENNTTYYVMKYVEGKTLKTLLGKYKFSIEELTDIIVKIGSDLDKIYKNEQILHRDISPENIILQKNHMPVLIDFGSAKYDVNQQQFTVVLKQNFAPLEQYSTTKQQGTYTDVYALAATYYYMLTGTYVPKAPDRIIDHISVPSLESFHIGVPQHISDAVEKALALRAEDRTQTMEEFIRDLTEHIKYKPFLILIDKNGYQNVNSIENGKKYSVGRGKKNDFNFMYQAISKNQLTIEYDFVNHLFVIKEDSKNGSYINDEFVNEETRYYKNRVIIKFPEIKEMIILEVK